MPIVTTPRGGRLYPRGLQLSFWLASALIVAALRILAGEQRLTDIIVPALAWSALGFGASVVLTGWGRRVRIAARPFSAAAGLALAGVLLGATVQVGAIAALGIGLGGTIQPRDLATSALLATATFAAWATAALMVAHLERAHAAELRAAEAQRVAANARLDMLRQQINPHFLFNALNSLAATIDEDRNRAQGQLLDLSRLLREALTSVGDEGTLGAELDRIEAYLRIEQARFESGPHPELHVADALRAAPCLPLLLQPLVENAIKHGARGGAPTIRIEAAVQRRTISVAVSNPVGAPIAPGMGLGLANVRERLVLRYGDAHRFAQRLRADGWMEVEVGWPCETPP